MKLKNLNGVDMLVIFWVFIILLAIAYPKIINEKVPLDSHPIKEKIETKEKE
ncbi:MAG: hypothetical protein ACRCXZ_09595 [Patescibacteria group bacterium]